MTLSASFALVSPNIPKIKGGGLYCALTVIILPMQMSLKIGSGAQSYVLAVVQKFLPLSGAALKSSQLSSIPRLFAILGKKKIFNYSSFL
jgi:hypothetical protein